MTTARARLVRDCECGCDGAHFGQQKHSRTTGPVLARCVRNFVQGRKRAENHTHDASVQKGDEQFRLSFAKRPARPTNEAVQLARIGDTGSCTRKFGRFVPGFILFSII